MANSIAEKLDEEKKYKTQVIIGLGFLFLSTLMFYWAGISSQGLIAGDMVALVLCAFYLVFLDRTKLALTNRLMAGLIVLTVVRAAVAFSVSHVVSM